MTDRFTCPYCEHDDDRLGLHGHLVEDHDERLEADVVPAEEGNKVVFSLTCPECDAERFSKEIPRIQGDGERLVDVYREELSMVAFDQLLYHLEDDHGY